MNSRWTRIALLASPLALAGCPSSVGNMDVVDVQDSAVIEAAPEVIETPDVVTTSGIGRACMSESRGAPVQGDCESGELCLPDQFGFPGGYCTANCASARCAAGSTCVPLGGQFRLCLQRCNTNSDCRVNDGYRCQDPGNGVSVCVPTDGPTGMRDGGACFSTDPGPHQLPALQRTTFSEANISLTRERTDSVIHAEGNVVVSPVTGAVATSYIAVGNRGAFMGVSTRMPDGTVMRSGTVRDPERQTTSDPVLVYTPDGRLHMVFMGYNQGSQGQTSMMRIRIATSMDDGRTWGTPRAIEPDNFCAGGCDKPWIITGPTPPGVSVPDGGTNGVSMYAGFMMQGTNGQSVELHMLRSDDGGNTWTRPMRFASASATSATATAPNLLTPVVSADGVVHVVYAGLTLAGGMTSRFGDMRNRVLYRNSRDGGLTWSNAVAVNRTADSPVYEQPVIVADAGRLHVAYTQGTNQGAWDLMLATSGDGGQTWQHRKVNDEPEACATHAFPWVVADSARARLHLLFLDNRFGDGNAVYASCPSDPAMPCGRNERVSDGTFTFETARDPQRWHGDYLGITMAGDGTLWAAWSDTRSGNPAMYLARGTPR